MHEVSIARGLCAQLGEIAREHGSGRIHRVRIEVGVMSNVVPDLLRHAFAVLREEIPLIRDAALEVVELPLRAACPDCGAEHALDRLVLRCPACDCDRMNLEQGDELLLRDVELEIGEKVS